MYQIEIYNRYHTPTVQDFKAVTNALYHHSQAGTCWVAGYSQTSNKNAKIELTHTGERGRPKKSITGTEVKPHIHVTLDGEGAYTAAHRTAEAYTKRTQKTEQDNHIHAKAVSIPHETDGEEEQHLLNDYNYILRQAEIFRQSRSMKSWVNDQQEREEFFSENLIRADL